MSRVSELMCAFHQHHKQRCQRIHCMLEQIRTFRRERAAVVQQFLDWLPLAKLRREFSSLTPLPYRAYGRARRPCRADFSARHSGRALPLSSPSGRGAEGEDKANRDRQGERILNLLQLYPVGVSLTEMEQLMSVPRQKLKGEIDQR